MRPDLNQWAIMMVDIVASRSTCHRRCVGCVFLNDKGHVIATGYNGVAQGAPHCRGTDGVRCPAADATSGCNLDGCEAVHAEQNALIQCRNVWEINSAYISCSPCMTCCKMLLNTSCKAIIYKELYDPKALALWERSGRHHEKWYFG